ncbi:hypothetical protein GJ629_09930 [Halapricum sp. CBA1109]|uniref:hypothetical protein n=1 Tax=Halapricum sp. CBA1109 TaxID=2668068 RepID=UPI0012FB0524|nr:hypothetical protein [Halapricum sp. CBA1109]MUV90167.1 hypothetical protein [Halapricum sp. CBA1109]
MSETVQCWLVERDYEHESMVKLVYATVEGDRHVTQQRSSALLQKKPVTAGIEVDGDRLEPVTNEADRERYAAEARRVAENNDPDDHL